MSIGLLTVARVVLGAWLGFLALLLLFTPAGAAEYARTGYPAWSRWLLGGMESVGGVLFAVPRTALFGGTLLFGSLMMAVGLHLGLRQGAGRLLLFGAAVLVLLCVHSRANR